MIIHDCGCGDDAVPGLPMGLVWCFSAFVVGWLLCGCTWVLCPFALFIPGRACRLCKGVIR